MTDNWYEGKRVAVTGGLGFVGSHLVRDLLHAGAKVIILDNKSRGTTETPGAEWVDGFAGNPNTLDYVFRGGATRGDPVDVVFNLVASVAGVLHNMNHHHEMFLENSRAQVTPLMVAERMGIPVFLQVSSVCVYDPQYNHPADPHDIGPYPHHANAGYSWAKRMGEQAVEWSNIDRPVIVRPSNIFGPRDYFDDRAHVIPAVMKRVIEEDVVHMYGPKDVVREFIYVEDVAKGMMAAAAYGDAGAAYNLGCNGDAGNVITMDVLVEAIFDVARLAIPDFDDGKEIVWHEDQGGGDPMRWSDCTRTFQDLLWTHKTSLREGLKETMKWYLKQRETLN